MTPFSFEPELAALFTRSGLIDEKDVLAQRNAAIGIYGPHHDHVGDALSASAALSAPEAAGDPADAVLTDEQRADADAELLSKDSAAFWSKVQASVKKDAAAARQIAAAPALTHVAAVAVDELVSNQLRAPDTDKGSRTSSKSKSKSDSAPLLDAETGAAVPKERSAATAFIASIAARRLARSKKEKDYREKAQDDPSLMPLQPTMAPVMPVMPIMPAAAAVDLDDGQGSLLSPEQMRAHESLQHQRTLLDQAKSVLSAKVSYQAPAEPTAGAARGVRAGGRGMKKGVKVVTAARRWAKGNFTKTGPTPKTETRKQSTKSKSKSKPGASARKVGLLYKETAAGTAETVTAPAAVTESHTAAAPAEPEQVDGPMSIRELLLDTHESSVVGGAEEEEEEEEKEEKEVHTHAAFGAVDDDSLGPSSEDTSDFDSSPDAERGGYSSAEDGYQLE
jgi:hypothetical protein